MAKLSMVTGDDPSDFSIEVQPSEPIAEPTPAELEPNLLALANTSDTPIPHPPDNGVEEDSPLLDESLMANDGGASPKRTPQSHDITKNPLANTLAIGLLSFSVIGGLAFIWWGLGAAKARTSIASDIDSAQIIEDAKDAEIAALQQQLYEQRASVALRSLKAEPDVLMESEEPEAIAPEPEAAPPPPPLPRAVSRPTPRPTSPPPPRARAVPPAPRPVAPQPIQRASVSPVPVEPEYDSLDLWGELASVGKVSADGQTEAIAFASHSPSSQPSSVPAMASWSQSDIPVVSIHASHPSPFPTAIAPSPGEQAILAYTPVVRTSEPTTLEAIENETSEVVTAAPELVKAGAVESIAPDVASDSTLSTESSLTEWADQVLATLHDHSDPGMAEALLTQSLVSLPEEPTLLASQSPVLHQERAIAPSNVQSPQGSAIASDESWSGVDTAIAPSGIQYPQESGIVSSNAIAQVTPASIDDSTFNGLFEPTYEQATVAIGQLAKAKVITPIVWDMEAPRPSDGIFTVELTEALLGMDEQVVLPEGTRLVADVSYVSSAGHVYQSIVAIILPNGEQIPVPVIGHEPDTGRPITPLVVRGRKGRALMADAVRRSGSNRHSLGNMLLSGVVAGVADATDNALQPNRSVQVSQGGGSSTVATQDNVRNATTAFGRGFFETTSDRLAEQLDEEPEAVQIYQVDTGEKVSVVVNGLMNFTIPVGGWSE